MREIPDCLIAICSTLKFKSTQKFELAVYSHWIDDTPSKCFIFAMHISLDEKKVILTVINDLVTDQRVDRTARVLLDMGYEVLMVGRQKSDSMKMPWEKNPYEVHRMRLLFEKGPLFYAEYNLRLFFFLVSQKVDLLFSNDLDTLLPDFLHHKLRKIPIIYDSHEYFTETPEVIHRPFVMKFWKFLEKSMVPNLKYCITVNQSIADLFKEKYGNNFVVVRNIPAARIKMIRSRAHLLDCQKTRR